MIIHANQLLTQALVRLTHETSKLDSVLHSNAGFETLVGHRAKEAFGLLKLNSVTISYTPEGYSRFQWVEL